MSHAFVEVRGETRARAILRGEGYEAKASEHKDKENDSVNAKAGKKERKGPVKLRSTVLGSGRRARGVTVTRSGQEELMAALFPSWRGTFDGARPSLGGLDNVSVRSALEGGLVSETEIVALLKLIREPDSHFLKVPILPFHALASVLAKFPGDADSRVFWSAGIRDLVADVAVAAVQTLRNRLAEEGGEEKEEALEALMKAAKGCKGLLLS